MPSRGPAAGRVACLGLMLGLMRMTAAHSAITQSDVINTVNALRAGGCSGAKRAPLASDARLQKAAGRIAAGAETQAAFVDAEYTATQMSSIHLSGYDNAAALRTLLQQKYCDLLQDEQWQQVGIAQRGDQLWIVLAAPQHLPASSDDVARQALELVNAARASARRCGNQSFAATRALKLNVVLNQAAQVHANDMASHRHMDHTGSDGSTPAARITRQGYRWKAAGENVAAGPGSAEDVVNGWLHSPGHCANIMSPAFTEMGLAFAVNRHDQYAIYWAQSFATPR